MKSETSMIISRYVRGGRQFYMKEVYCKKCHRFHTIPIKEDPPKCVDCKQRMSIRWKYIGNKLDYEEYLAQDVIPERGY